MREKVIEQKLKTNQDNILFECLKNLTISLYNEKGELIRKTVESKNHEGKEFDIFLY